MLVEIYTSLAALEAQRSSGRSKIRSYEELDTALDAIGSPGTGQAGAVDDHSSDALLAAAWLRKVGEDSERWSPRGMTKQIARTEGWTFGAR